MRQLLLCAGLAAMLFACGDNHMSGDDVDIDASTTPDAGVDAEMPDAMVCPARAAGEPGGPCTVDADCDSEVGANDGLCFRGVIGPTTFPPEGYCYVDDQTGTMCTGDGDCGEGETCVDFPDFTPYRICMPACTCAGNTCPENQACFDNFNGFVMDRSVCVPGNAAADDGDACDGYYECDDRSSCLNDGLEFPGGQCSRYACTIGDDSTCDGGTCIANDPPFTGTTCADTCTDSSDCRESEGYVCFDPDGAGTAPNYCRHPHVGDACADAADCSGGAWVCRTEVIFTGGYCTQTGCATPGSASGCSPGSVCRDHPTEANNYCADRCTGPAGTQGSCRTGYLCVDTDPGGPTTLGCVPAGG